MVRLLIELVVGIVGLFILTQIVLPIVVGRQTFWLFRKSYDRDLAEAEREREEAETQLQIARLKAETESIRVQAHQVEMSALDDSIAELEQNESGNQTQNK